jgi:predicted DNA-binding transcriptional regulator AlpA
VGVINALCVPVPVRLNGKPLILLDNLWTFAGWSAIRTLSNSEQQQGKHMVSTVSPKERRQPRQQNDCLDRQEFMQKYRMGGTTFWKRQQDGTGPRVLKIGRRVIITPEAERDFIERNTKVVA